MLQTDKPARFARIRPTRASVGTALRCFLLALAVTYVCEALSRHSPLDALVFALRRPHAYLYNTLLVCCFLSLSLLFRRRIFAYCLSAGVWVTLGVTNCVVCVMRITPLTAHDFFVFLNNMDISTSYVSYFEIALIALAVAAVAFGMVLVFRRAPKASPHRRRSLMFTACLCALTAVCSVPYALVNDDYTDPMAAYDRYGFAYSLCRSMVDRGVSRPANYGEEAIDDILSEVGDDLANTGRLPNIILLQLESFFDPANIAHITCSENPVPTFTHLKQTCSTGELYVPVIGGGTANVEFEVVTGMNLADFGTGEYPYNTILRNETCETAAFNLKELGYTTHAIHNHGATFYDRHIVFPMLGFDTFTSIEYMQDATYNALGWCRDETLTAPVLDALRSTPGADFLFAISVQAHGKYASDAPQTPYAISVRGIEDEATGNEYAYFVNELRDIDAFLLQLTQALAAFEEPVVLVAYGDHLPSITVTAQQLKSGSLLSTEYIIWTNDNSLPKTDRPLAAFQLAAYTLDLVGIDNGVLTRFHQQCAQNADYLEELQVIAYDMLYGDKLLYEGKTPYPPTAMRMGVKEITVADAYFDGDALRVKGEGFTRFSRVYMEGRALDTVFVDGETLYAAAPLAWRAEGGEGVAVCQVADDGTLLSASPQAPLRVK